MSEMNWVVGTISAVTYLILIVMSIVAAFWFLHVLIKLRNPIPMVIATFGIVIVFNNMIPDIVDGVRMTLVFLGL